MIYQFNKEKHIHTLDGKPLTGTTTIVGILSKPLSYWASGKAVEVLGWTNGKYTTKAFRLKSAGKKQEEIKGLDVEGYLKLLDEAYHAHAKSLKKSAGEGTDLHEELERYVLSVVNGEKYEYNPKIKQFVEWFEENVKEVLWCEGYCYSERLWVGGISDLGVQLSSGHKGVIDFKSSKDAYPSQFFQAAGYGLQIKENGVLDKDGNKIADIDTIDFHAIVPFGAEDKRPRFRYNVKENEEAFEAMVKLYKTLNTYQE